jgi:hypothetical protein
MMSRYVGNTEKKTRADRGADDSDDDADADAAPKPNVGIVAAKLTADSVRRIARDTVRELRIHIDRAIETAHASGVNYVEYALPSNFDIPGITRQDAQLLIYSDLVSLYRRPETSGGKGFTDTCVRSAAGVGARSRPATVFCVSWTVSLPTAERERRRRVISAAAAAAVAPPSPHRRSRARYTGWQSQ